MDNEQRADRGQAALNAYLETGSGDPECLETTMVDLLSDLRHLAYAEKIDFHLVIRLSQDHFNAELTEEEEA